MRSTFAPVVLVAVLVVGAGCAGGGGASGGGSGSSGGGSASSGGGSASSGGGSGSSGGGSASSGGGSASSGGGSASSGGGSASSGGGSAAVDGGFAEFDLTGSPVANGHFVQGDDPSVRQRSSLGVRITFGDTSGSNGAAFQSRRIVFTLPPDAGSYTCGTGVTAIGFQESRNSFSADAGESRIDQFGSGGDGGCSIDLQEVDMRDGGIIRGTFSGDLVLDLTTVPIDGGATLHLRNGTFFTRY